jgi:putative acetyltransferase
MIRKFNLNDLNEVMEIWLEANLLAHDFIEREYWENNYEGVKEMLPEATIYVKESDGKIEGFMGLMDHYIAGIFVSPRLQSKGIGKELLDYCKERCEELSLQVYQKNAGAVRFYEREGFTIAREQQDSNTNEKEYVMEWRAR